MQPFLWGGLTALLVLAPFLIVLLVWFLAKHDIIFTIVEEGTSKAIMQFGEFHHAVMIYEGYSFDSEWNVVKNEELAGAEKNKKGWGWDEWFPGGLRFVGIPFIHTVHTYTFRWTSLRQGEGGNKTVTLQPYSREEVLNHIIVQDDIYFTVVEGAETNAEIELMPVDVHCLLTIRITNPYRALFRVQEWLETVINKVKPAVRSWIATRNYKDVIGKNEKLEREIDDLLQTTGLSDYLKERYGVTLKQLGFVSINPSGSRGETYLAATTKQYEAEREKERVLVLAGAEVQRLEQIIGALNKLGPNAMTFRAIEALERTSAGQGNTVVVTGPDPVASIAAMAKGVATGSAPEKGGTP